MIDRTPGNLGGYRADLEQKDKLESTGQETSELMKAFRDSFPKQNVYANPLDVFDVLDQGQSSGCAGHGGAGVASACMFLATARKVAMSRGCIYYQAQRESGIRGDNGSTIEGCQKVMLRGFCTEEAWPYPSRYDNRVPDIDFPYKLSVSKPFKSADEVMSWNELGLPIHFGVAWNSFFDTEVVSEWKATARSGGHSCFLWLRNERNELNNINSWGKRWMNDGMQSWTYKAIEALMRHQFTVMIGYAPEAMSFPQQTPIEV